MKKKRFSIVQIVAGLKRAELGMPVAELSLDKAILQDGCLKKVARCALKREVVDDIVSHYGLQM